MTQREQEIIKVATNGRSDERVLSNQTECADTITKVLNTERKHNDSDLISKAIRWFQIIEEETRLVNAANLSHNLPCIRGIAIRSREYLEKHRMKEETQS